MNLIVLYVMTLAVFVSLNLTMLKAIFLPLFEQRLGDELLGTPRLFPAIAFYLMYPMAILYFVSLSATATEGDLRDAFVDGCLLGLLAYGTYDATSYATLRRWSARMMILDAGWGAFLTGSSAVAGLWMTALFGFR